MGIGFAKALERLRLKMSYLFDSDKKNQTQQPEQPVENTQPEIVESVAQQAVTQDPFTVENAQSAQPKKPKTARTQATKKAKSARAQAPAQMPTAQEIQHNATANFELVNDLDLNYPKETTNLNEKPKTKKAKRAKSKKAENDAQDIFVDAEQRAEKKRFEYKSFDDSTTENEKFIKELKSYYLTLKQDELNKELEKREKEIYEQKGDDAIVFKDSDIQIILIREELARKKECEELKAKGFVPIGENTAVMPNFAINLIGVSRNVRKLDDKNRENFIVGQKLFHEQYTEIVGKRKIKRFRSIDYTGYKISIDDWLTFLAVIKCAIKHQKENKDPFGILICKKRDIIDFIGWKREGGWGYGKILECLQVLTHGTVRVEWGKKLAMGHLIDGFYISKDDYERKTNSKAPESLQDLRQGEIYLRISPFILPFLKDEFFKINMDAVRHFLHDKTGSASANDLKVWLYFYLMSLPDEPTTKTIGLDTIKEKSIFPGELKRLKYMLDNKQRSVLQDIRQDFLANDGNFDFEWDKKDKYKLILTNFKRPRIFDHQDELPPSARIKQIIDKQASKSRF